MAFGTNQTKKKTNEKEKTWPRLWIQELYLRCRSSRRFATEHYCYKTVVNTSVLAQSIESHHWCLVGDTLPITGDLVADCEPGNKVYLLFLEPKIKSNVISLCKKKTTIAHSLNNVYLLLLLELFAMLCW